MSPFSCVLPLRADGVAKNARIPQQISRLCVGCSVPAIVGAPLEPPARGGMTVLLAWFMPWAPSSACMGQHAFPRSAVAVAVAVAVVVVVVVLKKEPACEIFAAP